MFFKKSPIRGSLGRRDGKYPDRKGTNILQVQEDLEFHVYWKALPHGAGPACSVYWRDFEIMKFDCFGGIKGHFHVALPVAKGATSHVLRFDCETIEQQIDRTIFEITHNLKYYIERVVHSEARSFEPDAVSMAKAAVALRTAMHGALAQFEQFASECPE